jgi:hypothetical protein
VTAAQWYAPSAALLIAVGFACGRRGRMAAAIVLLSAAELAATVALAIRHEPAFWLIEQVVIVFAVSATMAGAYFRLRQDLTLRGWSHARSAQLRERTRLAAEIHDTLGHDLTLLSLQAAAIQVKAADPEIRSQAAALRAGAAQAISTVRGLVDLLAASSPDGVPSLVERARAAGMTIAVTGMPPAPGFTGRLVTEALSNAARHALGAPVRIAFAPGGHVEISNPLPPSVGEDASAAVPVGGLGPSVAPVDGVGQEPPAHRAGTGLAALAARLDQAGGALTVHSANSQFRLVARIPDGIDDEPLATDLAARRRRLRTTLLAGALLPVVSLGVLSAGFYTWASHDATIEPATYHRLHIGMPTRDALAILPPREAPIKFGDPSCRHFTDGNFPLAYGNYEICFRDGRIASMRDSTGGNA